VKKEAGGFSRQLAFFFYKIFLGLCIKKRVSFFKKKRNKQTRGTAVIFFKPEEGCGNNRSVMPLDVPGCTRATMIIAVSIFIIQIRLPRA